MAEKKGRSTISKKKERRWKLTLDLHYNGKVYSMDVHSVDTNKQITERVKKLTGIRGSFFLSAYPDNLDGSKKKSDPLEYLHFSCLKPNSLKRIVDQSEKTKNPQTKNQGQ